jgi:hypothetical protein
MIGVDPREEACAVEDDQNQLRRRKNVVRRSQRALRRCGHTAVGCMDLLPVPLEGHKGSDQSSEQQKEDDESAHPPRAPGPPTRAPPRASYPHSVLLPQDGAGEVSTVSRRLSRRGCPFVRRQPSCRSPSAPSGCCSRAAARSRRGAPPAARVETTPAAGTEAALAEQSGSGLGLAHRIAALAPQRRAARLRRRRAERRDRGRHLARPAPRLRARGSPRTGSARQIADAMGHKKTATTEIYIQRFNGEAADERVRAAMSG